MTEKFIRIVEDSSEILDAVLDVMCFGKFPPEAVLIRTYRPFLSMVENYIRYYEDDVENQKMPVFLAFEQDESTKEILVEYLATRQTLFNPTTRDNVIREATKSFNSSTDKFEFILVSISPGAIALTVIPLGANSFASALVRPITPALAAEYATSQEAPT